MVGKYFKSGEFVLSDVYISVLEALKHASYHQDLKIKIDYFDSEEFEKDSEKLEELKSYDGIVVPGGFGSRGVEGIAAAVTCARENKIPYLGLCYGMHWLTIEYARNVANLSGANTTEVDKNSAHPVIAVMESQKENVEKGTFGGTMRLGSYPCILKEGSIIRDAYGMAEVSERHRHRFEVNPKYIEQLQQAGLVFSGRSPDGVLMEIAELPEEVHPFFVGVQFHPEFLSRPLKPHPLFTTFVSKAAARGSSR
jgi:CTP synthase